MKKILLAGIIGWQFFTLSFAQKVFSQTVSGSIIDAETHRALDGATILSKKQNLHTHSETNGSFKLNNVSFPDTLKISFLGYSTQELVLKQDTKNVEILMGKAHVSLNQVEVNGIRNISSQIMKVDLNQTPVNTTQDLLRKVPGLFIAQHAGGGKAEQIFLRGFDADHGTDVNISVDGMPVNMVSHAHGQGYADLHFVIPETVDAIDFGKGAYYADKGDLNTAGYVAFNTKNQLDRSQVKLEAGMFNTFRTLAMINLANQHDLNTGKSTDAYVAAEYNYTNGPFLNSQNFSRVNLFGKYNHWLNHRERVGIIASSFSSNWDASGQIPERAFAKGLVPWFGALDPSEGGQTSRTNVQVNYENHLDANHTFTSMAYYTKYNFSLFSNFTFLLKDQVKGDEIHQYENRQLIGMDHRYTGHTTLANSELNYYVGTALRFDDISNIGLDNVYRRNTLVQNLAKGLGNEVNTNVYANADWHLGKWIVNPGLRADYFVFDYNNQLADNPAPTQSLTAFRVSPKLNFFYNPNRRVQYFLKSGLGFHSNDMRVLMNNTNATNAVPISSGTDLGASFKPIDGLIIQPTLWYLYLQQEFVYVGDDAVVEPSGRSQRLGVDMSVRYQPVSWLYLYTDWNWARPRFLDLPASESYVPLAPTLTSTGGTTVQFSKPFSLSLSYRYMGDRPGNEDHSAIAKGYFINDMTLTYQLKRVTFNLQCQNLWNAKWREAQFYTETRLAGESQSYSDMTITPGTPRFIKGSVTFKF